MSLTVLSIAYPLTAVGPDAAGGSEQVLTMLDAALTNAGHRSLVIAREDSQVTGTLIPSPRATKWLDEPARAWGRDVHRQLIENTLQRFNVDLIHMHSLDFHCYVPARKVPVLATLHLPPSWYPAQIFKEVRPGFYMNCVSRSQHKTCPASPRLLAPVTNGVEVDKLSASFPKDGFLLALGRICPEKGFHLALDAAKRADAELLLAGELSPLPAHVDYFKQEIAPRLDDRRHFIGRVGFEQKRRLLSQAEALLIPSTVAETSSLVTMEAFACGTPVVAFRSGALPELIEDGRTGFLVADVDEMANVLPRLTQLDPNLCRQTARARFSAESMQSKYLALYRRLVSEARQPEMTAAEFTLPQEELSPAF